MKPALAAQRTEYNYNSCPLDSSRNEIRLLELFPGRNKDELSGRLFVVSLDHNLKYDALSYVWGDHNPHSISFSLMLDGDQNLPLRLNLRNALSDLRQVDKPIIIWTDAICIDQSNKSEVAQQVQTMGQIYSQAEVVRAWIDYSVDLSSVAFQTLVLPGEEPLSQHGIEVWTPVIGLLRNPYWKRLWIQQELILASKIILHCRQTALSRELTQALLQLPERLIDQRRKLGVINELDDAVNGFLEPFYGGISAARSMRPRAGSISLLDRRSDEFTLSCLLSLFVDSILLATSEPRDRVYGLLGLAIDYEQGDIVVDYALPLAEVYSMVCEMYVRKYDSLAFLSYTRDIEDNQGLPTWLPAPEKSPRIAWIPLCRSAEFQEPAFDHSGAVLGHHGKMLRVHGICMDRINWIGPEVSLSQTPLVELQKQVEFLSMGNMRTQAAGSSFLDDKDALSVLFPWWRVCDYIPFGLQEPTIEQHRSIITRLFEIAEETEDLQPTLEVMSSGKLFPQGDSDEEIQSLNLVTWALREKKFIGTAEGRIGLVEWRSTVQVNDEIWAIYGCPLPIILRPRVHGLGPEGYTWVACLFNSTGLMGGEGFHGFPNIPTPGFKHQGREIQRIEIW